MHVLSLYGEGINKTLFFFFFVLLSALVGASRIISCHLLILRNCQIFQPLSLLASLYNFLLLVGFRIHIFHLASYESVASPSMFPDFLCLPWNITLLR